MFHRHAAFALLYGVGSFLISNVASAEESPWNVQAAKEVPEFRWLDQSSPIRSLVYANEPYQGKSTEVFAFYATPGTLKGDSSQDKNLPGVVLIHGGGGTAFAEWVHLWAKRGYAAIAMDLSGRQPSKPNFDSDGDFITPRSHRDIIRERLENGGPEANHVAKFDNVGGDITDDWQFHAVSACVRAHSLLRSFPEVDADHTGVTGISWGGYMTCLVASLDERFKAAVPVYGCGFLYDGESVQKPLIDGLPDDQRQQWIETYDPSVWLPRCRVPILFVNGTNDVHYPLNSYLRSYELVPGTKQIRIEAGMRHSHTHGWQPQEIGLFIDQYCRNGTPLPQILNLVQKNGMLKAQLKSEDGSLSARLHFTTDSGRLAERKWNVTELAPKDGEITTQIPPDATICLISITDSRGAMVSTVPVFVSN